MRQCLIFTLMLFGFAGSGLGAPAKIIKVLPLFLDLEGRQSLSPSLYDRDAYQAKLRREPKERSALRFDVQWRSKETTQLKLRAEMRGGSGKEPPHAVLEAVGTHTA